MAQFKNTFRIESARLKDWDYSNPWYYYITMNTKNHTEFFDKVNDEKVILNELKKVIEKYWKEIPIHYSHVELDYFIIMPNHLHGILIINPIIVETSDRASLQRPTLGQIINQFKGSVKRWANKNDHKNFLWQSRFYDRIIRNEKELFRIRKYVQENPLKWHLEKNTPENIFI